MLVYWNREDFHLQVFIIILTLLSDILSQAVLIPDQKKVNVFFCFRVYGRCYSDRNSLF